jgi:hypothetical protein
MKQHITVDQLNELSKRSRDKLEEYMSIKGYWTTTMFHLGPSIGQMIEFLDEHIDHRFGDNWWNELFYGDYDGGIYLREENKEISDALWEAVKEILNKESL